MKKDRRFLWFGGWGGCGQYKDQKTCEQKGCQFDGQKCVKKGNFSCMLVCFVRDNY